MAVPLLLLRPLPPDRVMETRPLHAPLPQDPPQLLPVISHTLRCHLPQALPLTFLCLLMLVLAILSSLLRLVRAVVVEVASAAALRGTSSPMTTPAPLHPWDLAAVLQIGAPAAVAYTVVRRPGLAVGPRPSAVQLIVRLPLTHAHNASTIPRHLLAPLLLLSLRPSAVPPSLPALLARRA